MKYPNIEAERARVGMTKLVLAATIGVSPDADLFTGLFQCIHRISLPQKSYKIKKTLDR